MTMKIEGSNQALTCEPQPQTPSTQVAAPVAMNRVEEARVAERAFADTQLLGSKGLAETLERVPRPGVMALELSGLLSHNGGTLSVTAMRDEAGDFRVQVSGQAQVGLHAFAGAFAGGGAGAMYVVHTAEAAADLLQSLAVKTTIAEPLVAGRVAHYNAQNLHRVDLTAYSGAGLRTEFPVILGAVEAVGEARVAIDFDRHSLVIEQRVKGEAIARGGIVAVFAGLEGEISAKSHSEVRLPPEVLERIQHGSLSVPDALRGLQYDQRLILETEGQGEVVTFANESYSTLKKVEVEVDLRKLAADPKDFAGAIEGKVFTLTASEPARGAALELPEFSARASAIIYSSREEPLFGHHGQQALQSELDGRRYAVAHP